MSNNVCEYGSVSVTSFVKSGCDIQEYLLAFEKGFCSIKLVFVLSRSSKYKKKDLKKNFVVSCTYSNNNPMNVNNLLSDLMFSLMLSELKC